MENGEILSPLYERDEHSFIDKSIGKERSDIAGKSFVEFFKDAKPPNENVDILEKLENQENAIADDVKHAKQSTDKLTDGTESPGHVPSAKGQEADSQEKGTPDIIDKVAKAHAKTSENKETVNVQENGVVDSSAKTVVKTVDEIQHEKQDSAGQSSWKATPDQTRASNESFQGKGGGDHDEKDPPYHSSKVETTKRMNAVNDQHRDQEHNTTENVVDVTPTNEKSNKANDQHRDLEYNTTENVVGVTPTNEKSNKANNQHREQEHNTAENVMGVTPTLEKSNKANNQHREQEHNTAENVVGVTPTLERSNKANNQHRDQEHKTAENIVDVTHTHGNSNKADDQRKDLEHNTAENVVGVTHTHEKSNKADDQHRDHEHSTTENVVGVTPIHELDIHLNHGTVKHTEYDRNKSNSKSDSKLRTDVSDTAVNTIADEKMKGESKQTEAPNKVTIENNDGKSTSKKEQTSDIITGSEHVKPVRGGVSPPLIRITKPDDGIASSYPNKTDSFTQPNQKSGETADRSRAIEQDSKHKNRKEHSNEKVNVSGVGTSIIDAGLMASKQNISTKTDIAKEDLKINETDDEDADEKATHLKHSPFSAPKTITTLPIQQSEQEVEDKHERKPSENEYYTRNTNEESEAGDEHKNIQSVESSNFDVTKLDNLPHSKAVETFEHGREKYPSEKRLHTNGHKDSASENKPHVPKTDISSKEDISVKSNEPREDLKDRQTTDPDNSPSHDQLPFGAQETAQHTIHSSEILSEQKGKELTHGIQHEYGNNIVKANKDNVNVTKPEVSVPVISITKPQDDTSPKENVTNITEIPSKKEIKEGTKLKEYDASEKSTTNNGEDLPVVSNFDNSHSMYFTGRLPTLDQSLNTSPTEEKIYVKENETKQRELSPKRTGKLTKDNNHKEVELIHKDRWPVSGTEETTHGAHDKRVTSPSSEIKLLIQEINAPAQAYALSKEKPLTPRETFNGEKQDTADTLRTDTTLTTETKHEIDVEGKHVTVKDLNTVASGVLLQDYQKSSATKYDDLPHMKKILAYNAETESQNHTQDSYEYSKEMTTDTKFTRTVTDMSDKTLERTQSTRLDETTSTSYEIEQTALANKQEIETEHGIYKQKTSHSETDLKEMIASAKQAIGDESSTTGTTSAATTGAYNTGDGLICSNCLCHDSDFANSGFCHECQEYLCGKCKKLHQKSSASMYHHIMESYCTNELKIRKYIRATGYCKDCGVFLCGKCTLQHTGYRAFRRHKIIQSSFISRQAKAKSSTESTSSLNNTKESESGDEKKLMEDKKKERESKTKRKLYLHNLETNNNYGVKFANVAESLYPGPNKNLGKSYTNNPHWPYSSIPTLPYLVQPGNLQERTLKTPYLKSYKNPFYLQTKKAFDPNIIKMKALQSRYQPEPARRHFRRKEEGLFTARPLRNPVGASLPDITSARSYNMGGSYSHFTRGPVTKPETKKPAHQSNKLKTSVYCRDQCLSIPFPSNELPCVINGMEVLFDGRLVVLDKENNNVKLFSRKFVCKASLQFQNRLVDICSSNIYPTDIYVATPRDLYEVSVQRGMEIVRKMKVEIKRIEGLVCWKYGLAVVSMKSCFSWEVRLLDYRGNLKSKLEVLNPLTCEIEKRNRYHAVATKGGKHITIADTKNACCICVDVTTRCIVSETAMSESKKPTYVTSDHQNNVYVWCEDEVQQVSAKGRNLGVVVKLPGERQRHAGCIVYNPSSDRLYVQIKSDTIAIYKMNV